jgi:hypothetical protein
MSLTVAGLAPTGTRRHPAVRPGLSAVVLALLLSPLAVPVAAQSDGSDADVAAQGEQLVDRFLTILSETDDQKRIDLESFLAPELQLLRADGTLLTRDAYVENPASVLGYAIERLVVTGSGDVIVTSYLLSSTVTIDGVTRTTTAPRLTVFTRHGAEWLLAAHANFTPLGEAPATSPTP